MSNVTGSRRRPDDTVVETPGSTLPGCVGSFLSFTLVLGVEMSALVRVREWAVGREEHKADKERPVKYFPGSTGETLVPPLEETEVDHDLGYHKRR